MKLDKNKGYVFFIRHGQTEWNLLRKMQGRDEVPLNEVGLMQAYEASVGIKRALDETGFKFDRVVSSPLSRASKTGEIIAEAISSPFMIDKNLIERDFGVLSGTEYSPSSKAITEDVTVEGLEPISEVLCRVNDFISKHVKIGECTLAVSHGSVTKIFALQAERSPRVTNFNELLKNCHMIAYSYDGDKVVMEGYNISPENLRNFILDEEK